MLTVNRPNAADLERRASQRCGAAVVPDGEILARGPNVTQGYYLKPDETRELFGADGWLCTGDVGSADDEGFSASLDERKTSQERGGKLIAPQFIEQLFNSSLLIEQTYVVGDQRPYCIALIVPSRTELKAWAQDISQLAPEGEVAGSKTQRSSTF